MGNSARNAPSDMLEKVELESWPVEFLKKLQRFRICNFIISFLFLIHHNCILPRLVVYKKAYDISRKGSHPRPTPTTQQNHENTNPRV